MRSITTPTSVERRRERREPVDLEEGRRRAQPIERGTHGVEALDEADLEHRAAPAARPRRAPRRPAREPAMGFSTRQCDAALEQRLRHAPVIRGRHGDRTPRRRARAARRRADTSGNAVALGEISRARRGPGRPGPRGGRPRSAARGGCARGAARTIRRRPRRRASSAGPLTGPSAPAPRPAPAARPPRRGRTGAARRCRGRRPNSRSIRSIASRGALLLGEEDRVDRTLHAAHGLGRRSPPAACPTVFAPRTRAGCPSTTVKGCTSWVMRLQSADVGEPPDGGEVVAGARAVHDRAVADLDVAGEQHVVGEDDAVADAAVVRDVAADHEEAVGADARDARRPRACPGGR